MTGLEIQEALLYGSAFIFGVLGYICGRMR
jgi:hypothetical protein